MTGKGGLYGVSVAATALILMSATFAGYYYVQDSNANSNNSQLIAELNSANATYSRLGSNFDLLLAKYNQSVYLLSESIAVMNTSLPAYKEASAQLSGLWAIYQELGPVKPLLHNDVLFDFGNGTSRWYNDTAMSPGWNLYIESVVLLHGNINATWYPTYGEHLVTAIGGVSDSSTDYWFLWSYSRTASWQQSPVGADDVLVTSGSVYAWTYCGADANFNPTCEP